MFSHLRHSLYQTTTSLHPGRVQIIFTIVKLYFIKTKKSIILDSNSRLLAIIEQRQDNINQSLIPNLDLNAGKHLSRAIACFTINLLAPLINLLPGKPVAGKGVKVNCINDKASTFFYINYLVNKLTIRSCYTTTHPIFLLQY